MREPWEEPPKTPYEHLLDWLEDLDEQGYGVGIVHCHIRTAYRLGVELNHAGVGDLHGVTIQAWVNGMSEGCQ